MTMMVRMVRMRVKMRVMTSMTICRQKMVPGVLRLAATRRRSSEAAPMQRNAMQYTVQYHMQCIALRSTVHHSVYHPVSLCIVVYSCVFLCIVLYSCVSLCIALKQLHRLYRPHKDCSRSLQCTNTQLVQLVQHQ